MSIEDAIREGVAKGLSGPFGALAQQLDNLPARIKAAVEIAELRGRIQERAACAAIAREFCQIGDSDILREGDARRIYERILARGEVTR